MILCTEVTSHTIEFICKTFSFEIHDIHTPLTTPSIELLLYSMSNKTDPPRRKRKRSAYHPALACVVERHKPTNTEVLTEYQLTSEPLKADILLIRKRKEAKNDATILRGLWGLLPRRTIMEFKSIRTGLRRGDLSRLFGYAHIYDYSKLRKVPHKDELATVLLVPSQTRVLQEELKRLSLRWEKIAPGYFEVLGPTPFTCFVVVIDEVALDEQDPILGIFGHKKISSKLGPIPAWGEYGENVSAKAKCR